MISIARKGTEIIIAAVCSKNGYNYHFSYECGAGREDYAILLREALAGGLWDTIKSARQEAYEKGWKDAKRKGRKEDWFWGGLK